MQIITTESIARCSMTQLLLFLITHNNRLSMLRCWKFLWVFIQWPMLRRNRRANKESCRSWPTRHRLWTRRKARRWWGNDRRRRQSSRRPRNCWLTSAIETSKRWWSWRGTRWRTSRNGYHRLLHLCTTPEVSVMFINHQTKFVFFLWLSLHIHVFIKTLRLGPKIRVGWVTGSTT